MGGKSARKAGTATPAPGEDNNKRLAFLEAGVSSLAIALAGAGFEPTNRETDTLALAEIVAGKYGDLGRQIGELADYLSANHPEAIDGSAGACGTAVKVLGAFDINVGLLTTALSGAGVEIAEGGDAIMTAVSVIEGNAEDAGEGDLATTRIGELEAEVAALKGENAELETDLAEMTNLRNAAVNELVAVKEGREPEAKPPEEPEPEPEPAPPRKRPEAARDVGPTFGKATAAEIAELLADGVGQLEIALSNGEFEIVDFSPQPIERGALVYRGGKFHVEPAILVRGAGQDEEIAGAALLLNGEQLDYCEFDSPIPIEPGQERKFERMFVFG